MPFAAIPQRLARRADFTGPALPGLVTEDTMKKRFVILLLAPLIAGGYDGEDCDGCDGCTSSSSEPVYSEPYRPATIGTKPVATPPPLAPPVAPPPIVRPATVPVVKWVPPQKVVKKKAPAKKKTVKKAGKKSRHK